MGPGEMWDDKLPPRIRRKSVGELNQNLPWVKLSPLASCGKANLPREMLIDF